MADIDVGQLSEAINDKMDRDAHNVESPSAVVIESQMPTADNNYTWYRKYADGWVEQGGFISANAGTTAIVTTLPVKMADGNYTVLGSVMESYTGTASGGFNFYDRTTTSFKTNKNNSNRNLMWHISGMSAE